MKTIFNFAPAIAVACFSLTACHNDSPEITDGHGLISPAVELLSADDEAEDLSRAEGNVTVADLALNITSADGSYNNTWESINDYDPATAFAPGVYSVSVAYGDNNTEGFDVPAYFAEKNITVEKGKETHVSLKARLTKAMVSVTYTDSFKAYMDSYSATLTTADNSIVFAQDEARAAYVKPGDNTVNVTFKTPAGDPKTQQVASFAAVPHHHYHVKVDMNDGAGSGVAKIIVTLDDSLEDEDVIMELNDKD